MRTAFVLTATAFLLLVALPLTAQATPNCSECPDFVSASTDIAAALAPVPPAVAATLSPREARAIKLYQRQMLITSALTGETGGNDEGPPDLGGDGGSGGTMGGGGVVPEPATGLMAALGLTALALGRRRRA